VRLGQGSIPPNKKQRPLVRLPPFHRRHRERSAAIQRRRKTWPTLMVSRRRRDWIAALQFPPLPSPQAK